MSLVAAAQANPALFVGPKVAGGLVVAILQGVLFSQMRRYYRYTQDSASIQSLALFVNVIALTQSAIVMYSLWKTFIIDFGNWHAAVATAPWPAGVQSFLIILMSAPVQVYLLSLCWAGLPRSYPKIVAIALLLATNFGSAIAVMARSVATEAASSPNIENPYPTVNDPSFAIWVCTTFVADVVVMIILAIKKSAEFSQLAAKINPNNTSRTVVPRNYGKLFIYFHRKLWESTFPGALFATGMFAAFIACVLQNNNSRWLFFFQHIIGKFYCISLMIVLNGKLQNDFMPEKTSRGHSATRSATSIRIEVNRQVVRDERLYETKNPDTPVSKRSMEQDMYTPRGPEQIELSDLERSEHA
jgi:hypothetical protein